MYTYGNHIANELNMYNLRSPEPRALPCAYRVNLSSKNIISFLPQLTSRLPARHARKKRIPLLGSYGSSPGYLSIVNEIFIPRLFFPPKNRQFRFVTPIPSSRPLLRERIHASIKLRIIKENTIIIKVRRACKNSGRQRERRCVDF